MPLVVERTGLDSTEKVHRLRRSLTVFALISGVVGAVGAIELRKEFGSIDPGARLPVVVAAVFVATIGSLTGAYLGVRPTYERLRGIESTGAQAPTRFVRLIVVFVLPQAIWLSLFVLLRHRIPGVAFLALALAYLVLMAASGPLLVIAAMPTRAADPATREQFADDEVTAVMAHEIAHRKKHHILLKLATIVAVIVVAGLLFGLVAALVHGRVVGLAPAIMLPVLLFGTILLVNEFIGIRLERQADDYACATAGPEATRRMLEKLAELNMLKRRTGWLWNALQQHPGIQQRLDRVAARTTPEPDRAGSRH